VAHIDVAWPHSLSLSLPPTHKERFAPAGRDVGVVLLRRLKVKRTVFAASSALGHAEGAEGDNDDDDDDDV